MMMKGLGGVDESMSNLTSTFSGEASISSTTRNDSSSTDTNTMFYPKPSSSSSFASEAPPSKKKRSLPGNPDPDADVIALSPKSLLATNRFMCEICNKGFQRDQNLQLHRRGHNLPWKLKQKNNNEPVRKKVYVCPEPSCVHHDPSRALGDLTGIKKHYCRKHGEKKWKCDKCSKKYAVQSDWKAHSKICGTREYRCDCGTIFSRRDSFITHRAFCDALAEESARAINPMSTLPSLPQVGGESSTTTTLLSHASLPNFSSNPPSPLPLKREQQDQHHLIPPWLACPPPQLQSQQTGPGALSRPGSQIMDSNGHIMFSYQQYGHQNQDPNPSLDHASSTLSSFPTPPPPHMSATALLQKATEIGVAMSINHQHQTSSSHGVMVNNDKLLPRPHTRMSGGSLDENHHHNHHQQQVLTGNTTFVQGQVVSSMAQSSMHHDMMIMSPLQSIGELHNHHQGMAIASMPPPAPPFNGGKTSGASGSANGGGGDGLTRDFLGLRTFSHKDFLNMEALEQMSSSSTPFSQQQEDQQGQTPW